MPNPLLIIKNKKHWNIEHLDIQMSHILFVAVGQCTKDLKHELCSFPFLQIIMRIQVFEKFSTGNPIF